MFAMVMGIVPFVILIADAAFPERETVVSTRGEIFVTNIIINYYINTRGKVDAGPEEQLVATPLSDLQ